LINAYELYHDFLQSNLVSQMLLNFEVTSLQKNGAFRIRENGVTPTKIVDKK
jgi:hypothetical protein